MNFEVNKDSLRKNSKQLCSFSIIFLDQRIKFNSAVKIGMQPVKYLEDVPKSELEKTAKLIANANGRVMVVVHPFAPIEYFSSPPEDKVNKKVESYKQTLLNSMKGSKIPVIVFEEVHKMKSTITELEKIGLNEKVLLLPTSVGLGIMRTRIQSNSPPNRKEMIALLKSLGTKRVVLGGAYTEANYSKEVWEHEAKGPKNRVPSIKTISRGCVGGLYRDLITSGQFEFIRLMPNAIYGHKPQRRRTRTEVIERRRKVIQRKYVRLYKR